MWKPLIKLRLWFWLKPRWWFNREIRISGITYPSKASLMIEKENSEAGMDRALRLSDKPLIKYYEGKLEILNKIIDYGSSS